MQSAPAGYSIQTRLLVGASILLAVFLGLTGVVLDRAFRESVEAGAVEQLQVQIYVLLAAIEEDGGNFFLLEDLREPRFSQLGSGLYGFISNLERGELWRSQSALDLSLADDEILRRQAVIGENLFSIATGVDGNELFVVSYGVLWEDGVSAYNFTVMESAERYYSEISEFRNSLWSWLGGVAVLLLLLQLFFLRWGLSPLYRMARDLKQIESGAAEQLSGMYPRELKGVTDNLNLLIKTERKQQARYRTTLGDLAHSLKTPLAVISGVLTNLRADRNKDMSAGTIEQISTVEEQLDRMRQIVTYQLQRAVQVNGTGTLGRQVIIAPVINRILNALDKVYSDKRVAHTINIEGSAVFHGDERDLMEILGNVLDNAYKYGHSQVWVAVATHKGGTAQQLSITVEDDGPGIHLEQREYVLQRGARADTFALGQGIGLAVVTDIVSSYGGQIDVDNSTHGGARIQMVFNQSA
ncbi:MAG: ATP-binding protein [Pseudohongiellaceae bacterium]